MKSKISYLEVVFYSLMALLFFISPLNGQTGNWTTLGRYGSSTYDIGSDLKIYGSDSRYVTGTFTGTVDFGGITLSSAGNRDIFLLKQDINGNVLWARRIGGSSYDQASKIALDSTANIYIVGAYRSTASFSGSSTTLSAWGNTDGFVAKYDNNGSLIWAKGMNGYSDEATRDVTTDNDGNVYVCGIFKSTVHFGGTSLGSTGNYDGFIAKYDGAGNFIWANRAGSNGDDRLANIGIDDQDNIYTVGAAASSSAISFSNSSTLLYGTGGWDVLTTKYSPSGQLLWAKVFGGPGNDYATGISPENNEHIYISGVFYQTASFDGTSLTSNGNSDVFLAKLDAVGNLLWINQLGGSGNDIVSDAVHTNEDGNIAVCISFSETLTLENQTYSATNALWDLLVIEYNENGNLLSATQAGGANTAVGTSIYYLDASTLVLFGYFSQNLNAGNHTINSAGDRDCFTATLNLNQSCDLSLSSNSTNISCFGANDGSIDLSVSGGTAPYSFLWSDGNTHEDRNGLAPGVYSVTVTDQNGCQAILGNLGGEAVYYPFNGNAADASGNGNDAIVSGPALTTDRFEQSNKAYSFDGNDDYIIKNPINNFPSSAITAAFWMKSSDQTRFGSPISYATAAHDNTFLIYDYKAFKLHMQTQIFQSTVSGNDGQWNHFVMSWDQQTGEVRLYKNKNLLSTGHIPPGTSRSSNGSLALGQDHDCLGVCWESIDAFRGSLDEVYIFNRTLNQSEVKTLYNTQGAAIQISEPSQLSLLFIPSDVSCYSGDDGSIDITATGGTPPYTYLWNDGSTNEDRQDLITGTYSLTLTDQKGCTQTLSETLSANDTQAPEISCPAALTINTDPGICGAANIDLGTPIATDNCLLASLVNDAPTNFPLGSTIIHWLATDDSGNHKSCPQEVIVEDHELPTAVCQTLIVQLDANGHASITADDIDDGSQDACGIQSLSLNQTDFGCEDIGDNIVQLLVNDYNNNQSSCQTIITVVDNIAPQAICKDFTLALDDNGLAELTADQVNNGSFDACGIHSLSLNKTAFDCGSVGDNPVQLLVIDNNGNQATCQANVTVVDTTAPEVICRNFSLVLNTNGYTELNANQVDNGSFDACGIKSMALSQSVFSCSDLGDNLVTLTVTDNYDNQSSCTAIVSVEMGSTLPSPWESNAIGQVIGEANYDPCSNAFILSSVSPNYPIPLDRDEQQMVYQDFCDSVEIITRIKDSDHPWAGLQIRESLAADARMLGLKKLGTVLYQVIRSNTGGDVLQLPLDNTGLDWLRLIRSGDTFTGFTSSDGINWIFAFETKLSLNNCALIGLFAESLNVGTLQRAVFDSVQVRVRSTINRSVSTPNVVKSIMSSEAGQAIDFNLYPNPANDVLNIDVHKIPEQTYTISILGIEGRMVYQTKLPNPSSNFQIQLSSLRMPPGLYLVNIQTKERLISKPLVKMD